MTFTLDELLFYFFTVATLLPAILMVVCRNPINCAVTMILCFLGTAGLFLTLEAYLLAALQVLVYAGAVVVLFLFIIMLMNVEKSERLTTRPVALVLSTLAFLALGTASVTLLAGYPSAPPAEIAAPGSIVANFGWALFTKYMLPFQVAGFLLLVAMIGVIHLSKRAPQET